MNLVKKWLIRYWLILGVLAAWAAWVSFGKVNAIVAPSPAAVLQDLLTHAPAYLPDLLWTVLMSVAGLTLGMALGAFLALAVWSSHLVTGVVTPAALVMRSVPVVALIPIIGHLVGYGQGAALVVTVVISFFPAFVLINSALRSVPRTTADLFTVLGARPLKRLLLLHAPHALGALLVALRTTAPSAVLAAMLSEYLLGQHGLGRLFATSVTYMDTARAWGTALVAIALSVAFSVLAQRLERGTVGRFR
ncbi:MAG TPA: ABC transporter permease subunit [Streptomyces sp.]